MPPSPGARAGILCSGAKEEEVMGKRPIDDRGHETDSTGTDRRGFLRLAGLGTVVGGAALVAGTSAKASEAAQSGQGYRDTAHIRAYYDTARF